MISFFQEKDVERGECSLAAVTGIVNNPKLLLWTQQVTVHGAVLVYRYMGEFLLFSYPYMEL